MSFKIGNIKIKNNVGLSPMAGISNSSYMKICEKMGVGFAITELMSAEAIVRNNKKTFDMLKGIEKLKIPVGIQLFGSNIDSLTNAAIIIANKYKNIFIDINMGCPVPKIAMKSQAGSALLKNPKKVYELVSSVVSSVNIPVTVKIRSGWDENSINAVQIAKTIEKAGASAITVHPRTRKQGYSGKANWEIIKEVKQNVSIPVIGNGDIIDCYSAKRMIDETNCDAIMIGRASMGNPWIFKECVDYLYKNKKPSDIKTTEKIKIIKKHYLLLKENKNEKVALLEMRNHSMWYLKGIPNAKDIKKLICNISNEKEFIYLLNSVI